MFKIAKYKDLNGIKLDITEIDATVDDKTFKTLRFFIQGNMGNDVFSFSFDLNRPVFGLHLEDFGYGFRIDFNKYVQMGDEIFGYNDSFDLDPQTNFVILRLEDLQYRFMIDFKSENNIAGTIEFDVDFKKYL